jgi:hypothetical protein
MFSSCTKLYNIDFDVKELDKKLDVELEDEPKKLPKKLYNMILSDIKSNKLDDAGDHFVDMKTQFEKSKYLEEAALNLAIAHMKHKENILANFYIQEALSQNKANKLTQFLLIRNQFESAIKLQSERKYLKRAIETTKSNQKLLSDKEHYMLSNTMLLRLQLENKFNDIKASELYKKYNKIEAYKLYSERASTLGIDLKSIYKTRF